MIHGKNVWTYINHGHHLSAICHAPPDMTARPMQAKHERAAHHMLSIGGVSVSINPTNPWDNVDPWPAEEQEDSLQSTNDCSYTFANRNLTLRGGSSDLNVASHIRVTSDQRVDWDPKPEI